MKKILFRKILIDCFNFFLITLISASVIIWVFQAVNYLDIMIEDGRSFFVYTSYTLLNLPKIISKIFPFALFFSFFFILNKYELRNELLIFWTLGINKIEFVKFFVAISFLIVFLQITLTTLIVPMSQSYARTLIKTSNIDFFESFIKPKRFNDTINNLTIYADEKDKDGVLKNIYLKKSTTHDNFQITYAKKGFFKNINGNNILVLYDGETINVENKNIINFKFSESDFG
ncbi:LptF/LptG family permease, partial [Candidatus Pelagibacter bacterium]|nr:LptF/LptG family permease [Candidatus Pelagibacter bacterium]